MIDYVIPSLQIILTIAVALFVYVANLGKTSQLEIDSYITPTIFNLKSLVWASIFTLMVSIIDAKLTSCPCIRIILGISGFTAIGYISYTIFQIICWRENPGFRYKKRKEYLMAYDKQDIAVWDSAFSDINQYRNSNDFILILKESINYCFYLKEKLESETNAERKEKYKHNLAMLAEYYFPDLSNLAHKGNFILNMHIVYKETAGIFFDKFTNDKKTWIDPVVNSISKKIVNYLEYGFVYGNLCYVFMDSLKQQSSIKIENLCFIPLVNIVKWSFLHREKGLWFPLPIPDSWKPQIPSFCVDKSSFLCWYHNHHESKISTSSEKNDSDNFIFIRNTILRQLKDLIKEHSNFDEGIYIIMIGDFCNYEM